MKKCIYYFLLLFVGCFGSCTKDEISTNAENGYLISNDLMTLQLISETRANNFPSYLIKVKDLPNISIVSTTNTGFDADTYPIKSIFYDEKGCLLLEMHSNTIEDEKGILFKYSVIDGDTDCSYLQKKVTRSSGIGQGTADCINDAYSNKGWASVLLWVETAYIPFTAVAIAADCAIHNIFEL